MQTYTDNVFATDHAVQTDMQNVENNFAALKSAFSGATTPADTVAGMWWFDTTTNILKLRNETNNAWQSVWDFANNKPVITNLSNEITVAMMAAAIKDPAAGTAGLRTLGTGAAQAVAGNDSRFGVPNDGSVTGAKLLDYTAASTYAVIESSVGKAIAATVYTKAKEIIIPRGGALRISFFLDCTTINSSGSDIGYAKIYRNGSPVGIERSGAYNFTATYSEDISGWSAGDLVQLYAYHRNVGTPGITVAGFYLYTGTTFDAHTLLS